MKVTIDGTAAMAQYAAAFKRLRDLPGFEMKTILRAETGTILKAWAGKTKVATPKLTEQRAWYRAGKHVFGDVSGASKNEYNISVNTGSEDMGRQGWVWYRDPVNQETYPAGLIDNNGSFHPGLRRFPNDVWDRIRSGAELFGQQLQIKRELGRESVGFARQSVIQCAKQLGIDLANVAGAGVSPAGIRKAEKAIASNGNYYQNGSGTQGGDDVKCYVQCMTRLPYGGKIGMDRELAQIISRRAKYIETAFRKGATDSVAKAARAFPNVFRVMGSN
jgi:hypothetical protein